MYWWQENGKIEVFIKSKRYLVPNEDFIKYLEKETAKCLVDEEFYTIFGYTNKTGKVSRVGSNDDDHYTLSSNIISETHKAMYYNVLHFILCNMKYTIKVQIYDDGAVRLYQYDEVRSIWWDTPNCYTHPLNLYLLERLCEFVKEYKWILKSEGNTKSIALVFCLKIKR